MNRARNRMNHVGVAAEGFSDWEIPDATENHYAVRMQEFVVIFLRGFGGSSVDLGVGAYGVDLAAAQKRQSGIVWEQMYRQWIRAPLTNHAVAGMADAQMWQ